MFILATFATAYEKVSDRHFSLAGALRQALSRSRERIINERTTGRRSRHRQPPPCLPRAEREDGDRP